LGESTSGKSAFIVAKSKGRLGLVGWRWLISKRIYFQLLDLADRDHSPDISRTIRRQKTGSSSRVRSFKLLQRRWVM